MSIVTMILPFVATGLVLTAAALAWAYHKQTESGREAPPESERPDAGGDR